MWELFNIINHYIFSKIKAFWGYCFGYPEEEHLEHYPESVVPEQAESTSELASTVDESDKSLSLDTEIQKIEEALPVMQEAKFELNRNSPEFFPSYTKWSIKRNQFPPQLIELIDDLKLNFSNAKFYLTGAGPANILDGVKPNDYDILVIRSDLELIHTYLISKNIKAEKRSKKFPILFCDLGEGISVDFSVKDKDAAKPVNTILQQDYFSRDFNLNALYVEFTAKKEFSVFSFGDALATRHTKVIEAVGKPLTILINDPIRLFRLAKLLITNPTYKLGPALQRALQSLPGNMWLSCLDSFVRGEYGNRDRLDFAMRKLFERYSYEQINNAFEKIGLLTAFTDNTLADVVSACSLIPDVSTDEKYIYWVLANVLQRAENGNAYSLFPLHDIFNLSYSEIDLLDYIYGKAYNLDSGIFVALDEIRVLIGGFQLDAANSGSHPSITK